MNLNLLQTFVIFAKSKNIVEAARELRVSQPTVSFQLRRFEESFGHPLFSLQGKKKVLSPFGRALLDEVESLLSGVQNSVDRVEKRFSDPSQLLLRIGARGEVLSRVADRIRFPGALQFVPLPTQEALDRLLAHEVDIAISYLRPNLAHILSRKIFSDRVQWVCHSKWLKKFSAEQASQSPRFLKSTPFLAYKSDPPFLKEWLAHVEKGTSGVGPAIRPHRICEDWNALMRLVEQGLGYSLIPSSVVSKNPEVKTVMIPTEVLPEMTFYALYHFDLMKIPAIEDHLSFET